MHANKAYRLPPVVRLKRHAKKVKLVRPLPDGTKGRRIKKYYCLPLPPLQKEA